MSLKGCTWSVVVVTIVRTQSNQSVSVGSQLITRNIVVLCHLPTQHSLDINIFAERIIQFNNLTWKLQTKVILKLVENSIENLFLFDNKKTEMLGFSNSILKLGERNDRIASVADLGLIQLHSFISLLGHTPTTCLTWMDGRPPPQ